MGHRTKAASKLAAAPISLPLAAAFVAGPTIAISLAECLFRDAHRLILIHSTGLPGYLVWLPVLLSTLFLGLVSLVAMSFGRDGAFSLAAGYAIAWFLALQTRGSYIWPGFFDFATLNTTPFNVMLALSVSIAPIGAFAKRPIASSRAVTRVILGGSLLATLWAWYHVVTHTGPDSDFAYSRHIAVTIMFLALAGIYLFYKEELD